MGGSAAIVGVADNRWPVQRALALAIQTIWVLILVGVTAYKAHADGWKSFTLYLTNWVWMANAVFFALDLLLGYALPSSVFRYFSFFAAWIVYGLNWIVFWLVFVLFTDNASFLLKMTHELGGDFDFGVVMNGDRLFHVLTQLLFLLWLLFRFTDLRDAFQAAFPTRRRLAFVLTWLLAGVVAPSIILITYRLVHDPHLVYGIELSDAAAFFLALIILVPMTGLTLFGVTGLGTPQTRTLVFLITDGAWLFVSLALAVWWLAHYGAYSFFSHYEIWVWLYGAFFYLGDLICSLLALESANARARDAPLTKLVWLLFWPLNTLSWVVFWLSFVALGEAPRHVLDLDHGGHVTSPELLLDRVVRVLPVFALLVYLFVRRSAVRRAARSQATSVLYVVAMTLGLPLLSALMWRLLFSPLHVYGLSSPELAWWLLYVLVALLFGSSTLLLYRFSTHAYARSVV